MSASPGGQDGRTLSDGFQRPDGSEVGNGWRPMRGDWRIASSSLEVTGGTSKALIAQAAFPLGRTFAVEGRISVGPPGGSHDGVAFNIQDGGDGRLTWYAATLLLGEPCIWAVWELGTHRQSRLLAYNEIGISADHAYTIRVSSSAYRRFEVQILDGSTELVSQSVPLDPFSEQLAGGHAGLYSESGGAAGTFRVSHAAVASSSDPSQPPSPPPPAPLVCTPVAGPPHRLSGATWSLAGSSRVDDTQSRIGVGQPLLTSGDRQYVGYYDGDLEMSVASRPLGGDTWVKQRLGEHVGWDAHNGIAMAVDRDGHLHVSGDMHNVPLIYFRTMVAGDVTTLTRIPSMVDRSAEDRATYPVFLHDADGALIFNYRNGGSGNGSTYYNVYDEATRRWLPLFDRPMFDGEHLRNAYPSNPGLGPDGDFHMVWVWRETADAATNSRLCYARSRDMVHWRTVEGDPVPLPIVYSTPGVLVDPVPNYGGLLNGVPRIGFDAGGQVLISYYKFDAALNTQVYVARPRREGGWETIQVSRWSGRYVAQGVGAIPRVPLVSEVSPLPDGNLSMRYEYAGQSGIWIMDPGTLIPFTEVPAPAGLPPAIMTPTSTFPGMQVLVQNDQGTAPSPAERYVLCWEARPTVMDLPQAPPHPDPNPLLVHRLTRS